MTIVVNDNLIPNFTAIAPICVGDTLAALPTTSTNGISGTWSPALNNQETTTYTFTPIEPQCATTSSLTIQVNQIEEPTGESFQLFFNNATIADIVISPTNVIWYSSLSDALSNINPLLSTTTLIFDTTYYAVNDNGECRSQPFAVYVNQYLGINTLDKSSLKIFPNPVNSNLQITYNNAIRSVEIYSTLGQLLISKNVSATSTSIDMSGLPSTLYLLKIKSENQTGIFKILKQ